MSSNKLLYPQTKPTINDILSSAMDEYLLNSSNVLVVCEEERNEDAENGECEFTE